MRFKATGINQNSLARILNQFQRGEGGREKEEVGNLECSLESGDAERALIPHFLKMEEIYPYE